MDTILNFLIFVLGVVFGFVICKVICGNKFLVDRLIVSIRRLSRLVSELKEDNQELKKQNEFLKEQVKILQKKVNFLNEAAGNYENAVVRLKKLSNFIFDMVKVVKDYDYDFYLRFKEFLNKEDNDNFSFKTDDDKDSKMW